MSITRYVVGFVFSEDEKQVVLIRKNRPAWQQGLFNGVGGHVEEIDHDDYARAMSREFIEETGVEVPVEDWEYFAKLKEDHFCLHVFCLFSDLVVAQVQTMTDEEIIVVEVDLNQLRTTAISNLSWLIGAALDKDRERFQIEVLYA